MNNKTLCLNMIVKDESHVIIKTLEKLTQTLKFSYWVISDTGSSDNTKELIIDYFKKIDIPGELVEHKWKDFGYNRTKALECAYNKSDYLLIFDADDDIHGELVLPELTLDMYCLKIGVGFVYKRPLLVNNRKTWKFVGVLHEYLCAAENRFTSESFIDGNYYIESGKSGARSKDPEKYVKDAKVLENGFNEETDQGLRNRYAFYCAQSWMDANEQEKSIEWYKKVLQQNNWNQEKYYSGLMLGKQLMNMGKVEEAIKYYCKCSEYDNQRVEHIIRLMDYYYSNGMHILINALYKQNSLYRENIYDNSFFTNKLFVSTWDYEYKLEYYNTISAFYVGDFQSGYNCCKLIINANHAPLDSLTSAFNNIIFYKREILNDTENNLTELFDSYNRHISNPKKSNIHTLNREIIEIWNILYDKIHYKICNYNQELINSITLKKNKNPTKDDVFLSMTTCKRYDLFEKTINSILNNWSDINKIDHWFIVDDNSSNEDRSKMMINYPFLEIIFKDETNKGHRSSMNIIWNKLNELKPKYWIHLEDDFVFFEKLNYVTKAIEGLELFKSKNTNVKQILFNRAYAETIDGYNHKGYIIPEYTDEFCIHDYKPNYTANYLNCHYWPHYSFRPSLIDVSVILELGNFNSNNQFFEMDYANKWKDNGYQSAFFNKLTNIHIGRLTTERHNKDKPNAYELNNEEQFVSTKNENSHLNNNFIKIINLERRQDRKESIISKLKKEHYDEMDFDICKAVDGRLLTSTSKDIKIFKGNDFGNRTSFMGCALTHYYLWKRLLNDNNNDFYLIIEDDTEFCNDFKSKICSLTTDMKNKNVIFFGYHMYLTNKDKYKNIYYHENNFTNVEITNLNYELYLGGTHCYSINKKGAEIFVNYCENYGIKHGIDYVMGKILGEYCYESRPFLAFAEWNDGSKQILDTDIQFDINSLNIDFDQLPEEKVDENNNIIEKFLFFGSKDQIGCDLFFDKKTLYESMKLALDNEECVGFNTLGFFKNNIIRLSSSSYYKDKQDGIYIKKDFYERKINRYNNINNYKKRDTDIINVKIFGNWMSQKQIRAEWLVMCNENNKWNNIIIVDENEQEENIDYYVLINRADENDIYDPNRTILFQMEPWVHDTSKNWGVKCWGEWSIPDENKFLFVATHRKMLNAVQWQIKVPPTLPDYKERKDKLVSFLSYKAWDEGHLKRIKFSKYVEQEGEELIDTYGRGNYHHLRTYCGPLNDDKKENEYINYKYCLSVENNNEYNYATEKIWEPLLCEMLPFYWGCPNLEDYIDSRAFVRLDLNDFERSMKLIKQAIEEDWWSQRIDIIRNEKQKILNKLGFFPRLLDIINSTSDKSEENIIMIVKDANE